MTSALRTETAPVLDGSRTTCTSCRAPLVLLRTGYTCPRCGIVQGINHVDDDFSMASHDCCDVRSPKQAVVHGKQADLASSLGSYIDYSDTRHLRDAKHAPLPHHKQLLFRRLQGVLDTQYILANHYYRYGIVTIVKMAAEDLDISPPVQQRALYLYSKVFTCVDKMDYHLVSFIATAMYVASRECASPVPFTIQELCHALQARGHRVTVKMIFKHVPTFKHLCRLKYRVHESKGYMERLTTALAHDAAFCKRYTKLRGDCNIKAFLRDTSKEASKIIDSIPMTLKIMRKQINLAATAIYAADILLARTTRTKRVLIQAVLARATSLSCYSIRDRYDSVIKPLLKNRMISDI